MAEPDGVFRIGEVALRTNVTVPTLRAWEQRYGLLSPSRTPGGHRLYSEQDVERVRVMSRLIDEGWSAGAAAREARVRGLSVTAPDGGAPVVDQLARRLSHAFEYFDAREVDLVLDDTFARFDTPRAIDDVLLPVLSRLGDGWESDPTVVAREHFATHTVRPRLQRLLRAASRGGGRACIAAAPEHEEHDLGLLAASVVVAEAGWLIHYLGPRTPTSALLRAVAKTRPQVVLVATLFREHAERFLADVPDVRPAALVIGGDGFTDEDRTVERVAALHTAPISQLPDTLDRVVASTPAGR